MYHVTQLKNGLTVAMAEMPHMASVSLGLWVGVGSRYEPAELNGVCHFIEHLLFKGTRRRSPKEISEAVEGIGGYLNAFTSEEFTCFHARAGADRFGDLLDVLADMLLNSRFAPADIAKERDVIKEELAMYLDEPQHRVQELLNATLWRDQPLGRPITGTNRSLDAIRREHLLQYLNGNYVTGSIVIAAAGKLEHRQVVKAVERVSKHFKVGPRPQFAPAQPSQTRPQIRLATKKTEQTQIALGIRTCSRHDPRRFALRLLNAMLGENMSSRLFQIIREDRGLAYSIYSTPSLFHDVGDLVISAGLDADNVPKTLQLIQRELRRFTESLAGAAELRRARDYVIGQTDLSLESTDNQMNWVGEQWLSYGRVVRVEDFKRRLGTVTAAEIRSVARDFFRSDRINLALVSPVKSAASFEKFLRI
ncbi:MAG TPA: pitrilysin family protein [Candidatus Paceibacterota bacterium]|nr:pitrilysin family protein [Candidatus Paceibacterota bacterium]